MHRHQAGHVPRCPKHSCNWPTVQSRRARGRAEEWAGDGRGAEEWAGDGRGAEEWARDGRGAEEWAGDGRWRSYTAPHVRSARECDEPAAIDATGRCSKAGTAVGVRSVCVAGTTGPARKPPHCFSMSRLH